MLLRIIQKENDILVGEKMNKQNFITRSISAMFIGIVFFISVFIFRPFFYILFTVIAAIMLSEWYNMTKDSKISLALGQLIIPIPISSLMILSYIDNTGWILFLFFAAIWSVDMMAMVGGSIIKGPKLAPTLSPKKTISGLLSGVMSAIIMVNILTFIPYYKLPYPMEISNSLLSIFTLIIAFIAQASDLFISYFKRKFNIKDTGTIIPGHGGMLDRFDSIILTAPIVLLCIIFYS